MVMAGAAVANARHLGMFLGRVAEWIAAKIRSARCAKAGTMLYRIAISSIS